MIKKFRWADLLKKEYTVIQHLLFWLFIVLIIILFKEYPIAFSVLEATCFILQYIVLMAIPGYVNNYFVLPLFKKKKFIVGVVLYAAQIVIFYFILPFITQGIAEVFVALFGMTNWIRWENEDIAFNTFTFTLIASIINVAKESIIISREQKEAELRQLREQLNPHFLFNTLNNLYGLSVLKPEKLPPLMLKLSDLLRYSIYETTHAEVPLEKELMYIKNYIDLEKIRLEDRTEITLSTEGDLEGYRIAPMMLIVFVENCFKHASAPKNSKGYINISLRMNNGEVNMDIRNSSDPLLIRNTNENGAGGLGLTNVKKRLALIYPDKYELNINQQVDCYAVHLKINLNQ